MNRNHPILSFVVHAAGEGRATFGAKLDEIAATFPGTQIESSSDENQFIVSSNDESTLEAFGETILRDYEAKIGAIRIHFLETVGKSAKGEGKYIRQVGGSGNYGHCWLRVEPGKRGSGYAFRNDVPQSLIPDIYVQPIDQGVQTALHSGILAGFPLVDLQVTLFDGSYHDIDSNPMAFQFAATIAFKEAARKAAPHVLEPVMAAEPITPEETVGAVIGDINARRGRIISMGNKDGLVSISAIIPLAEALRSSARGRPDYPLRFAGYEDAPRGGFFDGDAPARANVPRSPWRGGNTSAATPETEF